MTWGCTPMPRYPSPLLADEALDGHQALGERLRNKCCIAWAVAFIL
jgi:hypothetical protein